MLLFPSAAPQLSKADRRPMASLGQPIELAVITIVLTTMIITTMITRTTTTTIPLIITSAVITM
jgi:hypothetical protein